MKSRMLSLRGSGTKPVPMPYACSVKREACERISVKAFMFFQLRNLRSNPSPRVVKNSVHIDTARSIPALFLCSF